MLGIKYDKFFYISDYFDRIQELCEKMMKIGKVYVDNIDLEIMKKERDERKDFVNRNNSMFMNVCCLFFCICKNLVVSLVFSFEFQYVFQKK